MGDMSKPEAYVTNFARILPDSDVNELQRILEMRGTLRKVEQQQILQLYRTKVEHQQGDGEGQSNPIIVMVYFLINWIILQLNPNNWLVPAMSRGRAEWLQQQIRLRLLRHSQVRPASPPHWPVLVIPACAAWRNWSERSFEIIEERKRETFLHIII
jgi:hypothetical protein